MGKTDAKVAKASHGERMSSCAGVRRAEVHSSMESLDKGGKGGEKE